MRYAFLITFTLLAQLTFGKVNSSKVNSTTEKQALGFTFGPPENKTFIDSTFIFTKLIFHTSTCYGNCPVMHLEISEDRTVKFSGNYFKDENFYEIDSARSGNFTGQLPEEIYDELIELIIQSNLPTENNTSENILCCDGAVKTIILYQNGVRKYYKAMFEAKPMKELVSYLYTFPEKLELTAVDENFRFEK